MAWERQEGQAPRWLPEVGQIAQLKHLNMYHSAGLTPVNWEQPLGWRNLKVLELPEPGTGTVKVELMSGSAPTGVTAEVAAADIQVPIGFRWQYTIYAKDESELGMILGWLHDRRGIAMRQSHYMPECPVSFQPADNCVPYSWKWRGSEADIVPHEQVRDRIKIVLVETMWDAFVMRPCKYCGGLGTRVAQECHVGNQRLIDCTCGHDHRTHEGRYTINGKADQPCSSPGCACETYVPNRAPLKLGDVFRCWTCENGMAAAYITGFEDKKEKKAAKAELENMGWKLTWRRGGPEHQGWQAERETVVKEYEEQVKEPWRHVTGLLP